MSGASIPFYFDYISPYAYIAWRRLERQASASLKPFSLRPVVFAGLLKAHGQLGPAQIPAKLAFTIRDCQRIAAREGIELSFPPVHPFNPILALRLSLASVTGADQRRVVSAMWRAAWARGLNLADPEVIASILTELDLDAKALIAATQDPAVKAELRANTDSAIASGVFGVPSFLVGGDVIWGADRFEDVLHAASDATAKDRVEPIFAKAAFVSHLGIELVDAGHGWVTTRLRAAPEHLQQDGVVHAGVLTTLADHSAGAAAGTAMDETRTPLTVELKVNLLRPAIGDELRCRAQVLRHGRSIVVAESHVFSCPSTVEKLVAKATVTLAAVETAELARRRDKS